MSVRAVKKHHRKDDVRYVDVRDDKLEHEQFIV